MTIVYGQYDQMGLEAQYDLRPIWPDVPDVVAYRENESARVRGLIPGRLDIAYGDAPKQRLDVFPPTDGRVGAPALIYIHGGYWQWNDKEGFEFLAKELNAHGAAFANIEYSLCPSVTLAELTNQCQRAVAHLWKEAEALGFDRDRIVVSGHSAGGHLTAMMQATDWPAFEDGLPHFPGSN